MSHDADGVSYRKRLEVQLSGTGVRVYLQLASVHKVSLRTFGSLLDLRGGNTKERDSVM